MNGAGHTRIAPAALRKTVEAVACQAFGVPRADVSASLRDDAGNLGVDLLVRLPAPPLLASAPANRNAPEGQKRPGLFEQAEMARLKISFRGRQVTGMELGRINIRLGSA